MSALSGARSPSRGQSLGALGGAVRPCLGSRLRIGDRHRGARIARGTGRAAGS